MSISIDDTVGIMVAAGGNASARLQLDNRTWIVSWLPTMPLTRNQALSLMQIADHVLSNRGTHMHLCDGTCDDWPLIVTWASECGLQGAEALTALETYAEGRGYQR